MSEIESVQLHPQLPDKVDEINQNSFPNANEIADKNTLPPSQQLDNIDIVSTENQKSSSNNLKSSTDDEELLGSVRTYLTDVTTVRTSARVIHKLREISSASSSTPERKENQEITVSTPKTPSHTKPLHVKVQWNNSERNYFYDALNEYGRDFEKISHFINMKMRRKASTDVDFKTKDLVRTFYYQLYNKASKYLRFSSDVTKTAQELYTVINYGEMKRKLVIITDKIFLKLRELVYRGSTVIRMKGRNIRIKTPACRALRKLNQLEGVEETLLPHRIDLIIKPGSMKSWSYVQSIAQNPRIKMPSLPLQKRLASVLATIHQKWQSNNTRLYDRYVTSCIQRQGTQKVGEDVTSQSNGDLAQLKQEEPLFTLMPPKGTQIHRPMVQLNELLKSDYLCLNSYEERIGANERGEALSLEKIVHIKDLQRNAAKRTRNDSSSDKCVKLFKCENDTKIEVSSTNHIEMESGVTMIEQDSCDAKHTDEEFMSIQIKSENGEHENQPLLTPPVFDIQQPFKTECQQSKLNAPRKKKEATQQQNFKPTKHEQMQNYKPLIDEESIRQVEQGWTLENVGDVTIGDLYLMFGSDCRLTLEYEISTVKTVKNDDELQIGPKLRSLIAIATLMEGASNPILSNFFSKHMCEKSTEHKPLDFKLPKTELYHRLTQRKAHPTRWWQQRTRNSAVSPLPGNHVVRDLYETHKPKVEINVGEKSSKIQHPASDEDVEKIIDAKISNIAESKNSNNSFSESSRSSMRSLFDCLTMNNGRMDPIDEDSSFSMKLIEAQNNHVYDSLDGMDNTADISLSALFDSQKVGD